MVGGGRWEGEKERETKRGLENKLKKGRKEEIDDIGIEMEGEGK